MDNSTDPFNEYDIEMWALFMFKVYISSSRWFRIFLVTTLVALFIAGFVGNILTCVVIYCNKKLHSATNFYIMNMAVSDAIVSLGIILDIDTYISNNYNFGIVMCKINYFFLEALWNNSILIMTTLAIERYLAIWSPMLLKSDSSWKRVMKVMIVIWIIAICETLPELLTVDLLKSELGTVCCVVPSFLARIVNGVIAVVTFIIPLLIMLFVYSMIAFKVNKSEQLNSKIKRFNHKNNRSKLTKLTVTLTLSFILSWLPFFTIRMLFIFCNMRQHFELEHVWKIGSKMLMISCWFSIVLNPIVFSLMSTKFRRALKILWRTKVKGQVHTQITELKNFI